jgi:Holliday junction resolvase RusA-like endonuclease
VNFKVVDMRFEIEVESHVVKKNGRSIFKNKKTGRMFPGKSQRLISAEYEIIKQLTEYKELFKITKAIDYPIHLTLEFYMKNYFTQQGNMSLKLPDLSNLYELPQDCLQQAGIIENDIWVFSHDGSRRIPSDTNKLVIMIDRYQE